MELPRSGTGSGVILGTILSTASFMIVAIVLPAVHINMQRKMTIMLSEVGECRQNIHETFNGNSLSQERRVRRASSNPYSSVSNQMMTGSCCSCTQGAPGQRGPPGNDGRPGKDGSPGGWGMSGKIGVYLPAPPLQANACQQCTPGPTGPPGGPGLKGDRGEYGKGGEAGKSGEHARIGPPGPNGMRGETGRQGLIGLKGDRGRVLNGAPPGPTGPVGQMGPRGVVGSRGQDGKLGKAGEPGQRGAPGERGSDGILGLPGPPGTNGTNGIPGNCNHCRADYLPSSRMPAPLSAPAPTYQPKKEPAPAPAPLPIQTNSYEAQTSTALPSPMPSHPQQPESTGDQYPRGEQNIPPQPIPQSGTYEVPKEQPASGTFEHPEQNVPSNANEPMQHVSRANQNKGKYDQPSPAIAAYAAPAFKPTGYYRDGKDGEVKSTNGKAIGREQTLWIQPLNVNGEQERDKAETSDDQDDNSEFVQQDKEKTALDNSGDNNSNYDDNNDDGNGSQGSEQNNVNATNSNNDQSIANFVVNLDGENNADTKSQTSEQEGQSNSLLLFKKRRRVV